MKGLLITKYLYKYLSSKNNFGTANLLKNIFALLRSNTIGIGPHLGIGIVSEEFKKNGVDIIDFEDIYSDKISNDKKYDFVGISFMDIDQERALKIENYFSKQGTPVIFGGQRATLGLEYLLNKTAATVVKGYVEGLGKEIISDLKDGKLKRVYSSDKSLDLKKDYVIADRNIIPLKSKTVNVLEIGRGCHNNCHFCSAKLMQPEVKLRDIGQIIEEVDSLKKKPLLLIDNNLGSYPPEYLREIFTFFNQKGIYWGGEGTITTFYNNPELIELMKKNCLGFFTGVEDFNNNTKGAGIDKNFLNKNYIETKELLRPFKKNKIPLLVSLVLGTDEQTYPESFEKTVEAVNELGVIPLYHIATPHPGTRWYNQVEKEGRILNYDLSYYDHKINIIHQPKNMAVEELSKGFAHVYNKTFLDPKSYVKRYLANAEYSQLKSNLLLTPFILDGIATALFLRYNKRDPKI